MGSEKNTTPNMSLSSPVVGLTTDPYWSTYIVDSLDKIDAHDHSPGNGAVLTQGSIQVSGDFSFRDYGLTKVDFVQYTNPTTYSPVPGNATTYFMNGDYYIRDGSGSIIQLTVGGGLNASLVGGFTGDYAASGAYCVFVQADNAYKFFLANHVMSDAVVGGLEIRSKTLNKDVYGARIQTSGNIAATYTITLADTLPVASSYLLIDATGAISYQTYVADASKVVLSASKLTTARTINNVSFDGTANITINPGPVPANDGIEYVVRDGAWTVNSGGSFPEAPVDNKQYARKNAAWNEIVVPVGEAPVDGKQYVRKDAGWSELSTTGGLVPLTASATLTVNTIYSVDATGDFTFVIPSGVTNGDTLTVKRNGFGGSNVFTGAFRNNETAIIVSDWNYSLKLTWSATRSIWLYE
jgi:hypothetical protein